MNEIEDLIELFQDYDTVTFKIIDCGKATYKTKEFENAIKALEKQLNGGWISVNERLPENYIDYIVTTISGEIFVSEFYGYGEECQGFKEYPEGVWEVDAYEETVIAWQALPEKYRESK